MLVSWNAGEVTALVPSPNWWGGWKVGRVLDRGLGLTELTFEQGPIKKLRSGDLDVPVQCCCCGTCVLLKDLVVVVLL